MVKRNRASHSIGYRTGSLALLWTIASLTILNPWRMLYPVLGTEADLAAERANRDELFLLPPRTARNSPRQGRAGPTKPSYTYSLSLFEHHSRAFPYMSNNPQGFDLFWPTGYGGSIPSAAEFAKIQACSPSSSSESPKYQIVSVPARQAYSHSSSVGSRYRPAPRARFSAATNPTALSQEMHTAGASGSYGR